jgi:hypothetical protein
MVDGAPSTMLAISQDGRQSEPVSLGLAEAAGCEGRSYFSLCAADCFCKSRVVGSMI